MTQKEQQESIEALSDEPPGSGSILICLSVACCSPLKQVDNLTDDLYTLELANSA